MFQAYVFCKPTGGENLLPNSWALQVRGSVVQSIDSFFESLHVKLGPSRLCDSGVHFRVSSPCTAGGQKDVLPGPVTFQLVDARPSPEKLLGNNSVGKLGFKGQFNLFTQ